MTATTQPITTPPRYTCGDCGLTARAPIVVKTANPRNETHGRCSNRHVNPAHLFLGTKADNAHDMVRKGRHRHGHPFRPPMTHCRKGHPISGDNAAPCGHQRPKCRICKNAAWMERHRRIQAKERAV